MSDNNSTRNWIIILVSILLGTGGFTYGVVQGQVGRDLERIDTLEVVDVRQDKEMAVMRTQGAVLVNELQHINDQMEDFGEDIKDIKEMIEKTH